MNDLLIIRCPYCSAPAILTEVTTRKQKKNLRVTCSACNTVTFCNSPKSKGIVKGWVKEFQAELKAKTG